MGQCRGTSTHLHNLSDDKGTALRLGRKAKKAPDVAARVQVDGERASTAQ
jgi:hypothetical protein